MSISAFTPQDIQARFAGMLPDLMGIEFVETSVDRVVARMKVRPDLCTAGGILHGGSIMAFADTLGAVGTVINMPAGARTTTVESSTKFLAGAAVNTVVTAESTAFHKGRTTMVWQTLIRNEAGRLCAVVTQTQLVMSAA
jgi:1,4-dihydroxy-2-naphthoyl-CoA hydrolase